MRIVFIHGRAQQGKDPVVLRAEWEAALAEGLTRAGRSRPAELDIELPFYGDTLDQLVQQLDAPMVEEARARGVETPTRERQIRNDILEEMRAARGIDAAEVVASYEGSATERGPQNWEWVHSILKVLDRTPLGSRALDLITRDVAVYLGNPAVRRQIDAIVAPAIATEPCVVVGHSLGSIVGYNVLSNTESRVARYITLGSPLGIAAVKAELASPLRMPKTTGSWFNAMDERDVVALRPLDQKSFGIDPPITNKVDVDNHTDNRHGIDGYLADPDVARWIVEALHPG